jgi:hypothetical protein
MVRECKACGKRLDFFEKMFGDECGPCSSVSFEAAKAKRREEQKERRPWRVVTQPRDSATPKQAGSARIKDEEEQSWVEVMLSVAWMLCFAAAAVFALLAVSAANHRYEQGPVIIFVTYAISLVVSGMIFAAIGKIISALTSVNKSLRIIASQNGFVLLHQREAVETATNNEG